jgi:hypothetical protein
VSALVLTGLRASFATHLKFVPVKRVSLSQRTPSPV